MLIKIFNIRTFYLKCETYKHEEKKENKNPKSLIVKKRKKVLKKIYKKK